MRDPKDDAKVTFIPIQARPSDSDSYGHINNAVYVSYFEQALYESLARQGQTLDWRREGDYYWTPQSLSLEYRRSATLGNPLEGYLWLAKAHYIQPEFGFEIQIHPSTSEAEGPASIFRAKGVWRRKRKDNGISDELSDDLLAQFSQAPGDLPRDLDPPALPSTVRQYNWDHPVLLSEVGSSGRVHLQALYQWLEESIYDACSQAGWPIERWLACGFFTLQTRHHSEIFDLPKAGEAVHIRSRLVDVWRRGGTWLLELEAGADGRLLVRDYSTGVHLDLEGRPATPPSQIISELQFGSC
jgi:acyl-CoA thioesterase FadM